MNAVSQVLTAGELGTFRGGSGFPVRYQGKKSGDLPFFKVSDMNSEGNEQFMTRANNYISEARRKALGAVRMPKRAIVFAKVGAAVFQERKRILAQDSCIDNNMAAFIVDESKLDVRFAYHLLTAFRMSDLVAVGALPSLNGGQLRSIPLLVPNQLSEQRQISSTLTDADDLISALERLIAKKRAIKQGMLQRLLSGSTRLHGFSDAWISSRLGALGSFLKGRGIKRDDVRAIGVPCIRYGEIYTAFGDYTDRTRSFVASDVAASAVPLRRGDVLFAGSGETKAEIGMSLAYVGDEEAVAGGDIVIFRGESFNPVFLASLLNTPSIASQKARKGQGDAVVHISSSALADLRMRVPDRDEQDAIAAVIEEVDRELSALDSRLDKARAIKQGMMQQLLTGRVRLPAEVTT
ncbi:restriction endonuclease subunit S [Curtobacterium sp. TC1]|uniref:restriction endonuclease subunit S n=1 Tax=Curtobacterium sp. TC1 TaxID=2862880 RepID=UPI001C9A7C5B|nr:restriction endonuclease subunit S [Curtobacterium sp. TC1]QZQ56820.1 restriction endonuclease subunit S [Curtobacterium sp. TC1]